MNLENNKLESDLYNPDFSILTQYQDFSKELTRISLLCLGILGFFLKTLIFEDPKKSNLLKVYFNDSSCSLYLSVAFLILSATCSIFHLYFSTDSFTHIIAMYRKFKQKNEPKMHKEMHERNIDFKISGYLLLFSCIFLILGITFGVSFYIKLLEAMTV